MLEAVVSDKQANKTGNQFRVMAINVMDTTRQGSKIESEVLTQRIRAESKDSADETQMKQSKNNVSDLHHIEKQKRGSSNAKQSQTRKSLNKPS